MSNNNHQNNSKPEPHIYLTKEEIQELNNELKRLGLNFYVKPANECEVQKKSLKTEQKIKPKKNIKNNNLSSNKLISKKRLSPSTDCESNINSENSCKKNIKNDNKCSLSPLKKYLAKLDKNLKNKNIQNDENQKMILIKDIMELSINFSEENLKKFCENHKLNTIGKQIKEDNLLSKKYNELKRIKEDIKIDLELYKVNSAKNSRTIRQEMEIEKRNYEKFLKKIEKKRQKEEIQNNNIDNDIELDEENYFRNNIENISNKNEDYEDSDKSEASFDSSLDG